MNEIAQTGLVTSREKTKVLRINNNNNNNNKELLLLNGEPKEDVDEFRYLGLIINKDRGTDNNKIKARKKYKPLSFNFYQSGNLRKLVQRPKSKFTEAR